MTLTLGPSPKTPVGCEQRTKGPAKRPLTHSAFRCQRIKSVTAERAMLRVTWNVMLNVILIVTLNVVKVVPIT